MPKTKSTHVDDPAAVGRRLRAAREQAGLSQRALAFPGCTSAYISRIEDGQRIPSLQLLRELGRRLGVSADYLATGDEQAAEASPLVDAEIALRLDEVDEARRLFQQIFDDAVTSDERADAVEGLAHVAVRKGELNAAIDGFLESARIAGVAEEERPTLADGLARAYAAAGLLAESIALLERCLERYQDDPLQFIRFAGLLSAALTDNGSFAEAERLLAQALNRGRETSDPYARARLYWSEARLRLQQGQPEEAEQFALRSLELLRGTEDTYALARLLQGLAQIYIDGGRATEALKLLEEGWPLVVLAGTPIEVAQYQLEEARARAALGQREEAVALAMELTSKLGGNDSLDAGRAFALLGRIFTELGDAARGRELLELAIEILEARGQTRFLVDAYKDLASLLKETGDSEGALTLLERALGVQAGSGRKLQ
jgi:tetratricopeptide (TPR) repeat protein